MKLLRFLLFFFAAGVIFSSCQKDFEATVLIAQGTLKSNGSECLPVTINGSYQKDTLLLSSNSVDVQVNFTQVGTYNVLTDTINGYSFSATGTAPDTGLHTIHLLASGRPIAIQNDVFHVLFDTSHCEINIVVTGPGGVTPPPPSTDSIVADINGMHTTFNISDTARYSDTEVPGYHVLDMVGLSNVAGDKDIILGVGLPGVATPVAGTTYDVSQYPASFVGGSYDDNITGGSYFVVPGGFTPTPTPLFQIHITTISATKITGTFSGAIPDAVGSGPDLQVTNGVFSLTIYP